MSPAEHHPALGHRQSCRLLRPSLRSPCWCLRALQLVSLLFLQTPQRVPVPPYQRSGSGWVSVLQANAPEASSSLRSPRLLWLVPISSN